MVTHAHTHRLSELSNTYHCECTYSCYFNTIMDALLSFFSFYLFSTWWQVQLHRDSNVTVTLRCQRDTLSSCAFCPTPLHSGWTAPVAGEDVNERQKPKFSTAWGSLWFTFVMLPPCGCCMKIHHCDSLPHTVYPVNFWSCWGRRLTNCYVQSQTYLKVEVKHTWKVLCHSKSMCPVQTCYYWGMFSFALIYIFLFLFSVRTFSG